MRVYGVGYFTLSISIVVLYQQLFTRKVNQIKLTSRGYDDDDDDIQIYSRSSSSSNKKEEKNRKASEIQGACVYLFECDTHIHTPL